MLPLLEKLSLEKKKEIILMGDFHINLLHSDLDKETSNFMDNIYSNSFFPMINLPTCITASSKTLIDNIFYIDICKKIKVENIATTISDHLTQFLAIPSKEISILANHNIMKPSLTDFDPSKFKNDLTKINWKNKLQIKKNNPHLSLRLFLKTIEELLNRQCPIKKVSQKMSYKQKPWITADLANSVNKKIIYINSFANPKALQKKNSFAKKIQTLQKSLCYINPLIQQKIF